jgi:hypothetical protein
MLVILQFPLAELRPFLSINTRKLHRPAWPVPKPGRDFVRGFGSLCKRSLGGLENWPGEDYYCEAAHAFRLADGWRRGVETSTGSFARVRCAFRRLLADGAAVARVEIAFDFKEHDYLEQLDAAQCSQVLRGVAEIPVRVVLVRETESIKDRVRGVILASSGKILAAHFLNSTTMRCPGDVFHPQAFWVQVCEPLMVVQHLRGQISRFPRYTREVNVSGEDIELRYLRYPFGQIECSIWFLGMNPGINKSFARRLRLHLLRLHAELECLRQVLRSIVETEIPIVLRSAACDNLQRYLADSIRLLSKESRYGVPQSELLKTVLSSQDLVTPGERETLLQQTSIFRGNILRSLEHFTEFHKGPVVHVGGIGARVQVGVSNWSEENNMKDQRINFGDNATVSNSNLVAANKIGRSSLGSNTSEASAEIKQTIRELQVAVTEMCKHLSPERAEEAAHNVAKLIQGAADVRSDKKWYEVSAGGLMEAAKSLGEIAVPVTTAVERLVRLFGT